MKVAIGFFGITRSLVWTLGSLRERIVDPLQAFGEVKTFASLVRQDRIANPRSGEGGALDPDEYTLLESSSVVLQEPGACLAKVNLPLLLRYGDSWNDNGKSLSNLVHQLATLDALHNSILPFEPDLIVFVRPDLFYHDSFVEACRLHGRLQPNSITVPNWQWARGINDRFAICDCHSAEAYASRLRYMHAYVDHTHKPLNSEEFLWWTLNRFKVWVQPARLRASRVRSNGYILLENFRPLSPAKHLRRKLVNYWYRRFGRAATTP